MESHYIPAFVESRWPRAACGLSSRFLDLQHSPEPTCEKCQQWLAADVKQAEQLQAAWDLESPQVAK